jgi:Protein of unknown function (DUF4197)
VNLLSAKSVLKYSYEDKNMRFLKIILSLLLVFAFSSAILAQTKKKKVVKKKTAITKTTINTPKIVTTTSANSTLTDDEVTGGLKEALSKGVKFAIDSLGKENGFLEDARVKIPLPATLVKIEKGMRVAGQGAKVDEFVASMNHAAEKAVPVAVDVFVDSIKQMTFTDAKNILFSKQDDSATQFFRQTTEENLRGKFRPIVEKFTAETGVTVKYKGMVSKLGAFSGILGKDATDLDGYVTQKALDGLFFMVAEEEKKIRKDPIGRTTNLLKKVFGAIFK